MVGGESAEGDGGDLSSADSLAKWPQQPRLKPGTRNSVWVSHVRDRGQAIGLSTTALPDVQAEQWGFEQALI